MGSIDASATTLSDAMRLHRDGRLDDAEAAYRRLISAEPRHADALRLLGLIAHQTGRVDLAIESMTKAVSINRTAALAHLDLARAYRTAGRIDEAIHSCREALELKPGLSEAWLELASIRFAGGDVDEARRSAERAVDCNPASAPALATLANMLRRQGHTADAEVHYRRAIELAPDDLAIRNNLGTLLQELGRLDEAFDEHRACLEWSADDVTSLVNLAKAYQALGRFDDALATAKRACRTATSGPTLGRAEVALASIEIDVGRWGEAAMRVNGTVRRDPDMSDAWYQLGRAYQAGGQLQDARACFDAALRLAPQDANVHLDRALVNIQCGRLDEGWDEYEWRWRAKRRHHRPLELPRWKGEPLAGRTILVHGEQGVGDEIMFASCVPDLLREAEHVRLTCDERLVPLFARSFPDVDVHATPNNPDGWAEVAAGAHLEIPAGSLPRHFRRSLGDFPIRQPFLQSDVEKRRRWRERLAELGTGLKVGICWRAGARPDNQRLRSLPLAAWTELLATPNVHWINLQHGDVRAELDLAVHEDTNVHDWPQCDPLSDFDDFAALVAALDLVISVGNATVHLAGALGRPAWVLLPEHWGWRWLADRSDTPWYPTVRLFRQQPGGDGWAGVLRTVRDELVRRI